MPFPRLIQLLCVILAAVYMVGYVPQRWWWQGDSVQSPFRIVGVIGVYASAVLLLLFSYWAAARRQWALRPLFWSLVLLGVSLWGTVWQMPLWVRGFDCVTMTLECLSRAFPPLLLAVILKQPLVIRSFEEHATPTV